MQSTNKEVNNIAKFRLGTTVGLGFFLLLSGLSLAQQTKQETFPSAEKASQALLSAVLSKNEEAITQVLGGDKDLVSSGDPLDDQHDRDLFVEKYREMHRLVEEPDGTTLLYIGAENWPFPVPLVSKNGKWFFDADAGSDEVLLRRVGENEADAIDTCRTLVAGTATSGAAAVDDPQDSNLQHGYYFRRVVEPRSPSKEEFIIAYPAEYRSSGVMTFIATPNNVVYAKDLGPQTAAIAKRMTAWRRDRTWKIVN